MRTISLPMTVNRLYEHCSAGRKSVGVVRVDGISHRTHLFLPKKLEENRVPIIQCLRLMNPELLRSRTENPVPWTRAVIAIDGEPWGNLEKAERLVALGIAIGAITLYPGTCKEVDYMPGIIIENMRIIRTELLLPRRQRNVRLLTWK